MRHNTNIQWFITGRYIYYWNLRFLNNVIIYSPIYSKWKIEEIQEAVADTRIWNHPCCLVQYSFSSFAKEDYNVNSLPTDMDTLWVRW